MSRGTRTRCVGVMVLAALLAALSLGPATVAAYGTTRSAAAPSARSIDLAPALGADGRFQGASGVAGTVDTSAWTLVSDLASGEPPRFAPSEGRVRAPGVGAWYALGSNGAGDGAVHRTVLAVAVSGSDLFVGGDFLDVAGIPGADYIARWDGTRWSAVGSGPFGRPALATSRGTSPPIVYALAVFGSDLYAGGHFQDAAGIPAADYVARWDGSDWSALGSGSTGDGALNDTVYAVAVSGGDIYVGGVFTEAAGIASADRVARWSGLGWFALGSNGAGDGALGRAVYDLAVSGGDIYVAGEFTNAAGIAAADYVARWDGSAWWALGSNGAGDGAIAHNGIDPAFVFALAVSGTDLYVGGGFTDAAGIAAADYVARWDGSAWSALGSNGSGDGVLNNVVLARAVSGGDLYAGGTFVNAAGIPTADRIAKWDGSGWSALGSNGSGDGPLDAGVAAIAIAEGVADIEVYVGGGFRDAGGIPAADGIAKWSTVVRRPDGRIRLGLGPFVGDDVYERDGASQRVTGSAVPDRSVVFGISIQNDGTRDDAFTIKATGAVVGGYGVRYFRGRIDITAAVVDGSYRTPTLARGAKYLIQVMVKVKPTAAPGSRVKRRVTITSVGDGTTKDAVRLTTLRA